MGLNSGLTITNETEITKEGSCHLGSDDESHTTSLLDNREHNYRQSSVIVCSLLVYQTHNKRKHYKSTWFTAAQRTAFFANNNQMGIPHATVVQLQDEGITHPDDLVDFDKDMIKQIADNL